MRRSLLLLAPCLLAAPAWAQTSPALLANLPPRQAAAGHGVTLTATDSENLFANTAGGVKAGATMQGQAVVTLQADMGKLAGLANGTFTVSAIDIHGSSLSPGYLDNLQPVNSDEGTNAFMLWELWYDQTFDGGLLDLKLGQQSIDDDFIVNNSGAQFLNAMAAFPLVPATDLYAGGPASPLAALAIRAIVKPPGPFTFLAGVFNDNPPGQSFLNDPVSADAGGLRFNLNTGALFIGELQYAKASPPGTYKIGLWYDTAGFPDQLYAANGMPLPESDTDDHLSHHGNASLYALFDQTIYTPADGRTLNAFGTFVAAPATENLIDFSFNGGLLFTGPFPARPNDAIGFDFGFGEVSGRARKYDRVAAEIGPCPCAIRHNERAFEITYLIQALPWLALQPDMQFIVSPSGGVLDPADPVHVLHNEVVLGLRATGQF